MIKIKNFCKNNIYNNFSLNIPNGMNYLKGKNGIGKTTLLDCISKVDKIYKGNISGNENLIYLNQRLYIPGKLLVEDFVKLIINLDNKKYKRNYFFNKINDYSYDIDFHNILKQKIGHLSGGELRLIFFIVTTILDKDWYVLDEPFNSIDKNSKIIMCKVIKKLIDEKNNVIITSHDETFLEYIEKVNIIDLEKLL